MVQQLNLLFELANYTTIKRTIIQMGVTFSAQPGRCRRHLCKAEGSECPPGQGDKAVSHSRSGRASLPLRPKRRGKRPGNIRPAPFSSPCRDDEGLPRLQKYPHVVRTPKIFFSFSTFLPGVKRPTWAQVKAWTLLQILSLSLSKINKH